MTVHHLARNRAFDPETTRLLGAVFESAWDSLRDCGHAAAMPFRADETRERLAKCIIELAQRGMRDPMRLRDAAVASLVQPNWEMPSVEQLANGGRELVGNVGLGTKTEPSTISARVPSSVTPSPVV